MNSEIKHAQDPASAPPTAKAHGIKKYMSIGTILPAIVVTGLVVVALVTITGIVRKAIDNKGLMPRPAALSSYVCNGFAVPVHIAYRHGMDAVQLRTSNVALKGAILNGKIKWEQPANGSEALEFTPPTEIVYDDAKSIRLIDGSGKIQECQR